MVKERLESINKDSVVLLWHHTYQHVFRYLDLQPV